MSAPAPNVAPSATSDTTADTTPGGPPDAEVKAKANWAQTPERSNAALLRAMCWVAVTMGRRVARWLLVPITLYYLFFSPVQAKNSRRFMKRVLGRDGNWVDGYKHIHSFASTILDRVYFLRRGVLDFDIRTEGHEALQAAAKEDPGAFLMGGHVGSFEVLRALGEELGSLNVAMVMYPGNAQKINAALQAIAPDKIPPVIALGRMESMLAVRDWLDAGGLAGMLADRHLGEALAGSRLFRLDFLGQPTDWIDGPMRMAALLRRRVFFMVGLYRGGNRYDVRFVPLVDFRHVKAGAEREAAIQAGVRTYVQQLEAVARDAPYNWFNFHDFWGEDAIGGDQPPRADPR